MAIYPGRRAMILITALTIGLALLMISTCPATMGTAGRDTGSTNIGNCKAISFRFDRLGQVQIVELTQKAGRISHLEWLSETQNGSSVSIHYRNGGKQIVRLKLPAARLHQMGFLCGTDGLAKLLVVDCATGRPIPGARVSETGGRYKGIPTDKDGWAMTACNCRPPITDVALVQRQGYQTKRINLQFSGRRIDRWKICLNKSGTVQPPVTNDARLGSVWHQTEAGIKSVWTRVGNSNRWKGEWENGSRADLTITVKGNRVYVDRHDPSGTSAGLQVKYTGTIAADGRTISGKETGPGWEQPWSAVIVR